MSDMTPLHAATANRLPLDQAKEALARANSNPGHNVYLALDADRTLREASAMLTRLPGESRLLFGVPVAVKDCFDVSGYPTTCGSRFYAAQNGVAAADSFVAMRLRRAGAVIMGKTHLHQLAYGITGENSEYGDSLQPSDPALLTGGSSSGSAASVQEGSAVAAIGTDTGGSIRVPAALCGLAGYRSTLGLGGAAAWAGGTHLAASFDTIGWLFRDLRDGPLLAEALFEVAQETAVEKPTIAAVDESFLHDCEPAVLAMYQGWIEKLKQQGAEVRAWVPDFWEDSREIFMGIQGHEAAVLHHGNYDHFERAVADRLIWGASLSPEVIADLRARHQVFRARMDGLLQTHDFLLLPCAPMSQLRAGADHSATRMNILRYTTPASLAGMPAVTLSAPGGGAQLIAARGRDGKLLAFAAQLTEKIALGS